MTKDEFKKEFKRLCDGYDYKPRPIQLDAFYDRLKHYQLPDWHEAVTDLLCASRFPMNLEIILDVIEKRADQRRRASVRTDRHEAKSQMAQLISSLSMRDALAEKPALLASMERFLRS